MQSKLRSVNWLATELRRDRRALARDLEGLPAAKVENQRGRTLRWYYLADVIEHLYLPVPKSLDGDEYDDQRQRLAAAQAEKVEHENAVRRGQLADMREVSRAWENYCSNARSRLLHLPSRIAAEMPEGAAPSAVAAIAKRIVYEALRDLSNYEPEAGSE